MTKQGQIEWSRMTKQRKIVETINRIPVGKPFSGREVSNAIKVPLGAASPVISCLKQDGYLSHRHGDKDYKNWIRLKEIPINWFPLTKSEYNRNRKKSKGAQPRRIPRTTPVPAADNKTSIMDMTLAELLDYVAEVELTAMDAKDIRNLELELYNTKEELSKIRQELYQTKANNEELRRRLSSMRPIPQRPQGG